MMGTSATVGQAVGTAAALLTSEQPDLRTEVPDRIPAVQQTLLRDGCFLPSVVNNDAKDLARSATVTASSEEEVTGTGPNTPTKLGGIDHWRGYPIYPFRGVLKNRVAQWIAHGGDREINTISLALINSADKPTEVKATLHRVDHIWDYRTDPGEPLAEGTLVVPAGGPQWIDWNVGIEADQLGDEPGYVRVDLAPNENVEWVVSPHVLPGQIATYEDSPGRYRRFGGGSTLSFTVEPPQTPYGPENVTRGATRPHRAANQWRSDPSDPLPQWIELSWDQPQNLSQVQLTFAGNLLREYHAYPPLHRDPQCVREYAVQVYVDGKWTTVAEESHNYSNRVVHNFDHVTSDRLRVVVYATNGDDSAGIYEIRCYERPTCVPTFQDA